MGFYSEEEKKELFAGFWVDQETRRVAITKIPHTAQSGKKMLKLGIRDVDHDKYVEMIDFNLLNALRTVEGEFNEDQTVFEITPQKTGEREWNGNVYDVFDFDVKETGEKVAPKADTGKPEEVPF